MWKGSERGRVTGQERWRAGWDCGPEGDDSQASGGMQGAGVSVAVGCWGGSWLAGSD